MKHCYDHPERVKGYYAYNDDLDACPSEMHGDIRTRWLKEYPIIDVSGNELLAIANTDIKTLIGLVDEVIVMADEDVYSLEDLHRWVIAWAEEAREVVG
jgi:hypothetical protein